MLARTKPRTKPREHGEVAMATAEMQALTLTPASFHETVTWSLGECVCARVGARMCVGEHPVCARVQACVLLSGCGHSSPNPVCGWGISQVFWDTCLLPAG